jgi:hypothetical protein
MVAIHSDARADLQQRLLQELGRDVVSWSPLPGGTQNRLFRLEMEDGAALLAKFYRQDRWPRLEREFSTLTRLEQAGFAHVPRALLRSDTFSYGVYSFEPGSSKGAAELEIRDLHAVAAFAADLHRVDPRADGVDVASAVDASFCLTDQLAVIDRRLRAFETFVRGPSVYDEVSDLCQELDLRALITELTAGLAQDERKIALPRRAWRLNTGDFGPQNLLFTHDGALTVVDFEAAGWDDPARLVMGFVAHAASEELPGAGISTFLAAYADAAGLSASQITRFERVGLLYDIEWIAIYASALTADVAATKQFANANFDLHASAAKTIALLKRRVARATQGAVYRFPVR